MWLRLLSVIGLSVALTSAVALPKQKEKGSQLDYWDSTIFSTPGVPTESTYSITVTGEEATTTAWAWDVSTQGPPANNTLGCGCDYAGLWLDVILVADSSASMTQAGLQSLMSYVATAFLHSKIGQGPGQKTRIGVVTYSDDATLRYPLTAFTSSSDLLDAVFNVPFENAQGSNIEAGLRVALQEFEVNGKGDYSNRKKVVIVAASHYEPGGSNDPTQAAATFRGNGGTLITIEYVQNHGTTVPILSSLASNCSQLTNRNEDLRANDLLDNLCRANCFCSANWDPYSLDQQCYTPDQGCYAPVTIPAAWPLAQRYCAQQNGATLPTVCDSGKAIFMTSLLKNRKENQWTGLYRQPSGAFTWDDGTDYNSCQPNQNPSWLTYPQNDQAVAQTSPSGFQNQFFGDSSFQDYLYTCQNAPCSSTLYCQ